VGEAAGEAAGEEERDGEGDGERDGEGDGEGDGERDGELDEPVPPVHKGDCERVRRVSGINVSLALGVLCV
jgi:hypothetical protein